MKCAEKYKESIERESGGTLYMGDQKDAKLLSKIAADAKQQGQFDIIIDDGGHNPTVQLLSLQGLWPALKSGGAYVEEDVHVRSCALFKVWCGLLHVCPCAQRSRTTTHVAGHAALCDSDCYKCHLHRTGYCLDTACCLGHAL